RSGSPSPPLTAAKIEPDVEVGDGIAEALQDIANADAVARDDEQILSLSRRDRQQAHGVNDDLRRARLFEIDVEEQLDRRLRRHPGRHGNQAWAPRQR